MSYEFWRTSYQSSEAAARAAYATTEKLHAELTALRDQLAAVGAGGVEPLRKPAAAPQAVQASVPVGTKFFSFDPCDDLVVHDTAEAACAAAQQSIDLYREYAEEGWAEEVDRVCWGTILGQALETKLSEDLPPDAFAAGVAGSLPPVDYVLHAPAHPAEAVPAQVVELEVDDLIDRLLNAQQDLNLAANVHMDQSISSASTLLDEVEIALRTLAATPAAGELATLQAGLQAAAPNAPLYDPREVAFSAQAAPQAVQAAVPVAGQSRFKGEKDWHWCSPEHVAMVAATPSEWQGYEARYLYAHAAPAHPAEGVPAQAVQAADVQDAERWMGIGKAIERACMDLPGGTEIVVSLEKDAGTVTLIDQDGNEHENFSCDYGFAGVLNEAIDAALAAQAKHEVQP